MIINTNIDAVKSLRSLNNNNRKIDKNMEKLSSGIRINKAADDSTGLAISEKMRAQIRGLNQAERNIQDGTSLLNVADSALQQAQNIVHRMRELAVQACNDTNTEDDRRKMNEEYLQLRDELDNIGQNTEFNGRKLFTGDYAKEIFKGLKIDWFDVVETDPLNLATKIKPTMTKSPAPAQVTNVTNQSITETIPKFPAASLTPQAKLSNSASGGLRPERGVSTDSSYYLSGDKSYSGGTTPTVDNIGGKIVANSGTSTLNVNNNTSYKYNLDGSTATWQWQKHDLVWDSNLPTYPWGAWYDYEIETVDTIEDHSEYGADGGIADRPTKYMNNSYYQYLEPPLSIYPDPPTTKLSTGNTTYDYEHDEWERAEIYSEATTTNVTNNNGGAIYVRNSAINSVTDVKNNSANKNYNIDSVSPAQARVDTNTHKVTVVTNSSGATVVSRNQTIGSTFNSTTNNGEIYCSAEVTTVTTNSGVLHVDVDAIQGSNLNNNTTSKIDVTTNSGTIYANSYTATIGKNSYPGTIVQLNSTAGSSFTLTDINGFNSGTVKTKAEIVKVDVNSGTSANLVTTNNSASSELTVTTNTGTIVTSAAKVNITTNNSELRINNPNAIATISNTNATSKIDTFAKQLNINGNANGSIRVENGAAVTINGANNATVSILGGGTVTVNGDLTRTTTVEKGATLTITGNITGTLYIEDGANVSFGGVLAAQGKIVFLGQPASFSPNPLNVPVGCEVELQDTTSINIIQNNGTVRMFNSTATIPVNNGTLKVNDDSTATVNANYGSILNLGIVKPNPNGSANTGTIDNWNKITDPQFTNISSGSINHNAPFATDDGKYDVSGIKFPNVVNGSLSPSVQKSVIQLLQNGRVYTLTAEWKPTKSVEDFSLLCECTVGVHNKNECTDHDLGLVADAYELKFDIDSIVPALQQNEQFVFWPNPGLNADGMRYDIVDRTIIYNVDSFASLKEEWEKNDRGLWLQTGANAGQGHNVYLPDLTHSMNDLTANCVICDCSSLKSANLLDVPNATGALEICDMVNSNISKVRTYVGVQLNRLMYMGNSVAISSENLSSAESRIRDADMAKEMAEQVKGNLLAQCATAVLAQANQRPENILQLLK